MIALSMLVALVFLGAICGIGWIAGLLGMPFPPFVCGVLILFVSMIIFGAVSIWRWLRNEWKSS